MHFECGSANKTQLKTLKNTCTLYFLASFSKKTFIKRNFKNYKRKEWN